MSERESWEEAIKASRSRISALTKITDKCAIDGYAKDVSGSESAGLRRYSHCSAEKDDSLLVVLAWNGGSVQRSDGC